MLIGDFDDLLSESLDGSNMKEERGQAVSGVDGRRRGGLRWQTVTPCQKVVNDTLLSLPSLALVSVVMNIYLVQSHVGAGCSGVMSMDAPRGHRT